MSHLIENKLHIFPSSASFSRLNPRIFENQSNLYTPFEANIMITLSDFSIKELTQIHLSWTIWYIYNTYFKQFALRTFRHLLCFWREFSERGISLHCGFAFYFFCPLYFFLYIASLYAHTRGRTHTWTHGRVNHCTTRRTKTMFLYRFLEIPYFRTIFSWCRAFQIKRNISIKSWIMQNWRRLIV